MAKLLLKCLNCGSYTFKSPNPESEKETIVCPYCKGVLKTPHPPKFSMDNKYSSYLRKLKSETNN